MPVARAACAREYLARLRETLSEKRLSHCIFTAEYFSSYAESIGVEHDKAVAAGLLHDLCRDMSKSELLTAARGLRVADDDRSAVTGKPPRTWSCLMRTCGAPGRSAAAWLAGGAAHTTPRTATMPTSSTAVSRAYRL